ncbi:unnamed protein product, partial [Symbiodinium necroappetens]
ARRQRLSTQEQLWMLLAARALTPAGTGDLALSVDGAPVEAAAPLTLRPDAAALAEGVTLTNRGEAGLRVTTTRVGVPDAPLPAASEGLTVARRLLDFQGREIDPGTLEQNDQAVVVLTGRVTDGRAHQALVVDLLPAGVELESVLAGRGTANDGFGFLPELTAPLYEARRDDRYVAALDLAPEGRFVLAYVVRAVTPGDFVLPAPFVEDMYAPEPGAAAMRHGRGLCLLVSAVLLLVAGGRVGLLQLDRAFPPDLSRAAATSTLVAGAEGEVLRVFATPDEKIRLGPPGDGAAGLAAGRSSAGPLSGGALPGGALSEVDPLFLKLLVA